MILKKLILANGSIIRKTIKMPNGNELVLGMTGLTSYMITNKEELDFLSKQRDVLIVNPSAEECVSLLESLPEIPTVNVELTKDESMKFDPAELDEERLKTELLARGYDVVKTTSSDEMSNLVNRVSDVALIQEVNKRCKANPDLITAMGITSDTVSALDFATASIEEVKQYLAQFGYIGIRRKEGD